MKEKTLKKLSSASGLLLTAVKEELCLFSL